MARNGISPGKDNRRSSIPASQIARQYRPTRPASRWPLTGRQSAYAGPPNTSTKANAQSIPAPKTAAGPSPQVATPACSIYTRRMDKAPAEPDDDTTGTLDEVPFTRAEREGIRLAIENADQNGAIAWQEVKARLDTLDTEPPSPEPQPRKA